MTATDPRPVGGSRLGRRVTLVALSLAVLLPAGLAFGLFPLLAASPFESADAIDPAAVASLRVFLLNRTELDGGDDVGPYLATPADYDRLIAPLRGLTPLPGKPADAVGPWLGEYRVRGTDGRRATIKLYWNRVPGQPPEMTRLRVAVGDRWFEGGKPAEVIAAAEAARPR